MISTKPIKIGAHNYVIRQLNASVGLTTLVKLTTLLGPALGEAVKRLKSTDEVALSSIGMEGIGTLMGQLCSRLTPEQMLEIFDLFVGHTELVTADKQTPLEPTKELHFAGEFGEMMLLIKEHLELNYSSFLAGLGVTNLPG